MNITELAAQLHSTGESSHLKKQMDTFARAIGEEAFCRKAAKEIIRQSCPETALPDQYDRFRPLIRDGIGFFLSRISYSRIREVIFSLMEVEAERHSGASLLALALHFPTLHKLGQVIARHPHLDPEMKQWLIKLENGLYTTATCRQVRHIKEQLHLQSTDSQVQVSENLLAEASVASVFPFTCRQKGETTASRGVFKVLKPGIADHLREELLILEKLADAFENDRDRYALHEIRLTDLFGEVQEDLSREIDLLAEQAHLEEAASFYNGVAAVRIPKLYPFCTPTLTAMDYLEGPKITDARLSPDQGARLARAAFEALICTPIFSSRERALFHGDPHAGNILAVPCSGHGGYRLGLLDWTLAGHLEKGHRKGLIMLMIAIIKEDAGAIVRGIEDLAADNTPWDKDKRIQLVQCVEQQIISPAYQDGSMIKKSFQLMERMTLEGIVFPSPLLLFRKAFFTLEGVLDDIAPGFVMEPVMDAYICMLVFQELPQRTMNLFLPAMDKAEAYQSLLANHTLHELGLHQVTSLLHQAMKGYTTFLETQTRLTTDLFNFMTGGFYCPTNSGPPPHAADQ